MAHSAGEKVPPGDARRAEDLSALRAGDPEAFEALVRAHGGRLLMVARRLVGNDEDALDVLQNAFLSAFRSIHRFQGESLLSTWLHRIVVNAALILLRARRRRPEQPIEVLLPAFHEDGHQANPAVDWRPTAEAELERKETQALVRKYIDSLPENYRLVLLLRDIEELDTEETARLLGITPATARVRLHRARQALRGLLDPHLRGRAEG
jgi:RNA polymerase sigma-70 factor (ECF subfamily)